MLKPKIYNTLDRYFPLIRGYKQFSIVVTLYRFVSCKMQRSRQKCIHEINIEIFLIGLIAIFCIVRYRNYTYYI